MKKCPDFPILKHRRKGKEINGFSNAIRGNHVSSYIFTRHVTNSQPQPSG